MIVRNVSGEIIFITVIPKDDAPWKEYGIKPGEGIERDIVGLAPEKNSEEHAWVTPDLTSQSR